MPAPYRPKVVFIDTEFTGERQYASLVSIAITTLEGDELYLTFHDFNRGQVNTWLEQNVLNLIDDTESVGRPEGAERVYDFLASYSQGDKLYFVSAGLSLDMLLLYDLYGEIIGLEVGQCRFQDLPDYLQNNHGVDLNTLFRCAGYDPEATVRSEFAGGSSENRHNALADVRVVRECFLKLLQSNEIERLWGTFSG